MDRISWAEFEKVEIITGTVLEVESFPEARVPAYVLKVDFGEKHGIKRSSARITDLYSKGSLIGKQVIGVLNFPPKQIGPLMSECLITGFTGPDGKVVLAVPDTHVENGLKLA